MAGRNDAAGEGSKRPALTVRRADAGCRDWSTVDSHILADFNLLTGKCRNGLDERRKAANAETIAKISALPRFQERRAGWRTDEDEIANRDWSMKLLYAPEPERLARRQV